MKCCLRLLPAVLPLAALFAAPAQGGDALLVKNGLVINIVPGGAEVFAGYLAVGDDGRVSAIGAGEPPASLTSAKVIDARGSFIAPGFISAHSHIFTSPVRGLGHTETLYGWGAAMSRLLNYATAEDMYWFTLHGSLDFLRNGITTAYDFTNSGAVGGAAVGVGEKVPPPTLKPGPFEENQIRAKADAGLRFIDSVGLPRVGTREEMLARLEKLLAWVKTNYGDNPLFLRMAISGGLQRAPTKETAELEAHVMKTYGLINQSHFLESPERVPEQQAKFWWYRDAGALGPNFIFGHFIQATPEIAAVAAQSGASMSWQPTSNSRLASGVADINLYRALGMKVGVGLDDQSCTDISDPFQNLRIGLALIRTTYKDAKALNVADMLFLHTLSSAEILHVADKVGSLEPGKFADFLIVDPRDPDTGPLHDPIATYVLACGLRNLKQVYVGGKLVVEGTKMLSYDESIVRREVDTRIARLEKEATAAELMKKAAAARDAHDREQAITLYTAALEVLPTSVDALLERGFLYWGAGKTDMAAEDFTAAVNLAPDSPRALIARGDLVHRYLIGDFAACERDYARAYAIDPTFPGYFSYTAELYLYTGEPARVITESRKGLTLEPGLAIHKMNLAHGLLFSGDVEAAKKLYAELATVDVGHGRLGPAFALRDFATLEQKGRVKYAQIAQVTPWLQSLAQP